MARGLNLVHLIGTLTQKPDLRYTPAGLAILDVTLAGNDHVVGNDHQLRELAWYHRTTVFGKQAENLVDQVDQGTALFVDGRLNYRAWDDPNGQRRSSLDIKAIRVDVLGYGARGNNATVYDAQQQPRLKDALNYVMVVGNLTRDVELRYTPSGFAVARMGLAVNDQYRDKQGYQQESVHFIDVQVWRELAESCGQLVKGDPILVIGRLTNDSWTDKDGNKRFTTRVEGTRVEFLTRGPGFGGATTQAPQAAYTPMTQAAQGQVAQAPQRSTLDIDEEFPPEEELPF